jgi:L-serine dehydratase
MKNISILNDVLGPVMRGPSSSHTAASWHIAVLARSLLGEKPVQAEFLFDEGGSYGLVFRDQGSDLAFAAGLLGWPITDTRFRRSLLLSKGEGLDISFRTGALAGADHPNDVAIHLLGEGGKELDLRGRSVGGGSVEIREIAGWPLCLTGSTWVVVAEVEAESAEAAAAILGADGYTLGNPERFERAGLTLLVSRRSRKLGEAEEARLDALSGLRRRWQAAPLMLVKRGEAPFASAAAMLELARHDGTTAGRLGMAYEAAVLGLSEETVLEEMGRRLDVMLASVETGLAPGLPPMRLIDPSAATILKTMEGGGAAFGGFHSRAAARSMAALHVNCGMGVVCAAPTAGSAGVLPGVMATLVGELGVDRERALRGLFAAGLVGVFVAERSTFAAEVAGCQVEIGAAGAMAAAAVVEAAGGDAEAAAAAAAVCLQNTMGSVCDLVQGVVEIPCHTRNAVAASSAFVVADLVMGGYRNPIPLDETIDAMDSVGRSMPPELRVTSLGGLAVTPSALRLEKRPWAVEG